jgi:hypothetical protein
VCPPRRFTRVATQGAAPPLPVNPGTTRDGAASGRTAGFEQGLMPETYTAFSNKKNGVREKANPKWGPHPLPHPVCKATPVPHTVRRVSLDARVGETIKKKNTTPSRGVVPLNVPPISLRVRKPVCFGSPASSFPPRGPMKRCRRFFLLFRHPPERRSPLLGGRRLDLERSPQLGNSPPHPSQHQRTLNVNPKFTNNSIGIKATRTKTKNKH